MVGLMEASNLQIYWHESQPIYSLCLQPCNASSPKLLTAGGDNRVRAWTLNFGKDNSMKVDTIDFLSSLTGHEQAVNVIRFNFTGDILASAGDDGQLLLWKQNDKMVKEFGMDDSEFDEFKESWTIWKKIRSGSDAFEIYDLAWSPDERYIATASMDNSIRIFDVETGKCIVSISNHSHYVQGVVWDPLNQFIFSQSADRSLNVYDIIRESRNDTTVIVGLKLKNKVVKGDVPYCTDRSQFDLKTTKNCMLFYNETLPSFFRRSAISPCGSLFCVPAGIFKSDTSNEVHNCVYIYTRAAITSGSNRPVMCIPFLRRPAIAVQFNPNRYALATDKPYVDLSYKLIFAVATSNEILIYDTENVEPMGVINNLHYTPLTDLTWSRDGKLLMVSSTDGFCSYVHLDQSVLGTRIEGDSLKQDETRKIDPLREDPKKTINILPVKRPTSTRKNNLSPVSKRMEPILIPDDQHHKIQQR